MLLQNAKIYGREGIWTIQVEGDTIQKIVASSESVDTEGKTVIDLEGKLVLPPFVEPHIHLDYALTAGTPRWNMSGTLFEGIQIWSERKVEVKETKEDIKKRALAAMKMQLKHGVQHVRSHVDVTDPSFVYVEALLEVKEEMKDYMDLQLVSFPQEGFYGYDGGEKLVEEGLKMGLDVVGGIPHFEPTREDGVKSVHKAIELAVKYDKLVDIHCDEIDDDQSRFVEVVASEAKKAGIGNRVSASHTCAMGSYNDAYMYKLMMQLKKSGIHFISLPKANLHLQGRNDTYPKRRGLTRVKELLEADINVCFGQDSIQDPWYPLGDANMISVLEFGLHAAHLTGYNEIMEGLDLITFNGAKAMNISDGYGIVEGNKANMIVLNTDSEYEVVRTKPAVIYSIRNGKVIVETKPEETTMNIGDLTTV